MYRYRYMCLFSVLYICMALSANTHIVHTTSIEKTKEVIISCPFNSTSILLSDSLQGITSVSDMDANGITRRPRRIAGGDKDSFGEGEDGEKLPEVTNQEQNKNTPIGDIPTGFMVLLCTLYIGYLSVKKKVAQKRDCLTIVGQSLFLWVRRLEIIYMQFEI